MSRLTYVKKGQKCCECARGILAGYGAWRELNRYRCTLCGPFPMPEPTSVRIFAPISKNRRMKTMRAQRGASVWSSPDKAQGQIIPALAPEMAKSKRNRKRRSRGLPAVERPLALDAQIQQLAAKWSGPG